MTLATFRVLRYSIPIQDTFHLPIPAGAVPISVANSRLQPGSHVDVWVRTPSVRQDRTEYAIIRIAGTGHDVEDADATDFLGSVITPQSLVFHVFYRRATNTDEMAIR